MSSFEASKFSQTRSRVATLGKRPPLLHRSSDPEFSDAKFDDAVDMGENAVWANLEELIYAEKDVEIFRLSQNDSSLPVYYAKGWLPFSADTLFDALMDARYRESWDMTVHELHVIERQNVSDVMYFALKLPWPLADRDYVYRRQIKFYPTQNAFVVLYQAANHGDAPAHDTRVRVETCTLSLSIRSLPSSNDSCDFHLEYEDDTDFSIPNYMVNLLLRTRMPSFMTELRKACTGYADYVKTLDDDGIQSIPSRVVRHRSDAADAAFVPVSVSSTSSKSAIGPIMTEEQKTATASPRPQGRVFFNNKRPARRVTDSRSEEWDDDDAPRSDPPTMQGRRIRSLSTELEVKRPDFTHLNHSSSADCLSSASFLKAPSCVARFSCASSVTSVDTASRSGFGLVTPLDDDFVVNFRKQKTGLHVKADVFSNKVLVAFCKKHGEAGSCGEHIEPGFLMTSVNGISVSDFKFSDIISEIQRAPRPLKLGFTRPDREAPLQYHYFKEPQNVVKCLVSKEDINDLVGALRPLDEGGAISAMLKCDFVAFRAPSVTAKAKFASASSSSALSELSSSKPGMTSTPDPSTSFSQLGTERVLVPAGYLIYEINDLYVLDMPFDEITHLLRCSGDSFVVTIIAAAAIVGESKRHPLKNKCKIPKRLSGVFGKKRNVGDASTTANIGSTSSQEWTSKRGVSSQRRVGSAENESKFENCGLTDYSSVIVTSSNIDWVWQQVVLLKATERIFSAGLLIDRLEAFLAKTNSTNEISSAAKTRVLRAMHDERELVDHIKERRDQGVKALKEFSDKECDDEWQFGHTMLGVTTFWKPDEDGSVWIKLEGHVDGVDIFNTISVIREVDLYSVWAPFFSQSLLIEETGHVELAAYLAITSPFLQRDTVVRAFGINAVYESRCLLLLGGSVDASSVTSSVPVPTLQGWNAKRIEVKGFRALIEPLTRMQARTCIVANIDPKFAIPKPMLNFGIKKMAGVVLHLIRKEAEKIQNNHKSPAASAVNEHLHRIKSDPSGFYTWLRPIVDKYFADQHNNNLPAPLSLISNVQVEWTADTDDICMREELSTRLERPRLATKRRTRAFERHGNSASSIDGPGSFVASASIPSKHWYDYIHDFAIWPYVILFIFAKMSSGLPLPHACALKFVFTCTCTWLAVPGVYPHFIRQRKRRCNELKPLRQQCLALAAILDVLSSWALRVWVRWGQCFLTTLLQDSTARDVCFSRSPAQVRESEDYIMLLLCFLYASIIVSIQLLVHM
ncbi:unnamed protein product [Peronospora belbahrii]|uniref:START domain-containing protein n=1 Tax=Peronospora belbahrii TaxID=622444 RepID=A0ABN8CJG2_9STRA|nr:unnamed protein product [Peronospora belbahrii]